MIKLKSPCTFQGGKSRLAPKIVDEISSIVPVDKDTVFYDLCCGSGAISLELINRGVNPKRITMLDTSSFGMFWKMIGEGSFSIDLFESYIQQIPNDKSEIQAYIKQLANKNEKNVYVYLLLQAASFGGKQVWWDKGKWRNASFRSYWKPTETSSRRYPVNPIMPMPDELFSRVKTVAEKCVGVNGINGNIFSVLNTNIPERNAVFYIDPPYKNTTKYGFSFDVSEFVGNLLEKTMSPIFLSEGEVLSDEYVVLSNGRKKGGVSGDRKKKPNLEILNIYR